MLTDRQKYLFKELGFEESDEKYIRKRHKDRIVTGDVKDFTRWLTKCVHSKWRRENERNRPIYVGD